MTKKVDKKKPVKTNEPFITDIVREYFTEKNVPMVKIVSLSGDKVIDEKVFPSSEDNG